MAVRLNGRADGVRAAGWHMGGGRGRRGVGLACTGAPPGREQCDVQGVAFGVCPRGAGWALCMEVLCCAEGYW